MESIIAAGSDARIPELDPNAFSNQASYVQSRTSSKIMCPTPVLKPNGIRTARVSITDGNFLDLSSMYFSFDVVNNSETLGMRPLNAIPSAYWNRALIKVNGTVVEDVNHWNKLEQALSLYVATNKRRNYGDLGTGWAALSDAGTDALPAVMPKKSDAGHRKKCVWRPLGLGFASMQKFLPLLGGAAGGLSIECSLADAADAVLGHAPNSSTDWSIENFAVHVDSVQLNSEMTSMFADLLIEGRSILLPYQTNNVDVQYLSGGDQQLSLAKMFSRLNTVFVAFESAPAAIAADDAANILKKPLCQFYLDSANSEKVKTHLQIGTSKFPQFDTEGSKEHMVRLMQALGVHNSASHSVNISADGYASSQFIAAWDLETIAQAEASGMPVQGGAVLSISAKDVGAPVKAYIFTHADAVCEIRSQGAVAYS
jgi:hypothetical protein